MTRRRKIGRGKSEKSFEIGTEIFGNAMLSLYCYAAKVRGRAIEERPPREDYDEDKETLDGCRDLDVVDVRCSREIWTDIDQRVEKRRRQIK